MNNLRIGGQFDGETYIPMIDHKRLTGLLKRVYEVMSDGHWHTLYELAIKANGSQTSVSARVRDLRKDKFGGMTVERRRIDRGLFEYRLKLEGQQGRLF